jgi:hypothetical protein
MTDMLVAVAAVRAVGPVPRSLSVLAAIALLTLTSRRERRGPRLNDHLGGSSTPERALFRVWRLAVPLGRGCLSGNARFRLLLTVCLPLALIPMAALG